MKTLSMALPLPSILSLISLDNTHVFRMLGILCCFLTNDIINDI